MGGYSNKKRNLHITSVLYLIVKGWCVYLKIVKIVKHNETRYIIINNETGEIIDEAQGYGYKSKRKAHKVIYYKYKRGREKLKQYEIFWKSHKEIATQLRETYSIWFKEISKGEITTEDMLCELNHKFNTDIPKHLLKHFELAFKEDKTNKKGQKN